METERSPPVSLLDTDLYKLTMQQAVFQKFPDAQVTYRFGNRSPDRLFSRHCIDYFKQTVSRMSIDIGARGYSFHTREFRLIPKQNYLISFLVTNVLRRKFAPILRLSELSLTQEEYDWLKNACPYLKQDYLSYLSNYRFKPDQLTVHFLPSNDDPDKGRLDMVVEGPWVETILWEVPLMSLLSEAYFRTVDVDWNHDGQEGKAEQAYSKGLALLQAGVSFNEFGTRRRRSHLTHDLVIKGLKRAHDEWSGRGGGKLLGTSNVFLAYKHGLKPMGTIAHEWFMGIGALLGYQHVHSNALDMWREVYGTNLLIALTDTFTTDAFYKEFTKERAMQWTGLRQDSGDPFVFAPRMKAVYEELGVDATNKLVVFSDSQNVELAKKLQQQCDNLGMKAIFGIGTNFTNDFRTQSSGGRDQSKSLNIVIKIASIDGKPCVKLSDDPKKHTGDPTSILKLKEIFGLEIDLSKGLHQDQ